MAASIIIPTYNRSSIIHRAINSVKNQSVPDWELIIVDDCSKDNTTEIVEGFIKDDNRIKLIKQDTNQGAPAARNKGAFLAKYELLVFLDSDDELHPDHVKKITGKFTQNPTLGMVYTGAEIFDNGILVKTCHQKVKGKLEKYLYQDLKGLGGSLSGFSVPKAIFDKIRGFDKKIKSQQDLDIFIRIAALHDIDYIEGANAKIYNDSSGRISDNSQSVLLGNIYFLEKHEKRIKELGLYHHVARKLARRYANAGQLKNALKLLLKAIYFRPIYFYAYIYTIKLPFLYLKNYSKQ